MISCPFVDSRSPPDVSSLLTNPALRCSGGQLQPPAIPGPTPLVSMNLHFPQLIFKRNHLHAHPCFSFLLRKKIKRGEKRLLHDVSVHLFSLSSLFWTAGSENMVRATLHAGDMSYYTLIHTFQTLSHIFSSMITNLYPPRF